MTFFLCATLCFVILNGCTNQYTLPPAAVTSNRVGGVDQTANAHFTEDLIAVGKGVSHVRRITNREGWEIPSLAQTKLESPSETYLSRTVSPRISLTELTPDREVVSKIHSYFVKRQEEIIVLPVEVKIIRIERFSFDGRPFCYIVHAKPLRVNEQVKATIPSKYLNTSVVYYDEDKDGKFEVLKSEDVGVDPRIPEWVLKDLKQP